MGRKRRGMNVNPNQINDGFKPIFSINNICPYFGVSPNHFVATYRDDMVRFGLMWLVGRASEKKGTYMTSPFLINIFHILKNKERMEGINYDKSK